MCNLNDWRKKWKDDNTQTKWLKKTLLKINKQRKQQQHQRQTLLKKPSLDKTLLKNYHPIFNLPFLLKILEFISHKLLSHLQENNLSNPFQSAYRAGHSTETVLLHVINGILCTLDNDNISVLLLLDLYAAFDTFDHQILLSRLNSVFGIQSSALQWFQSYLSDRYQSTLVNNSSSSPSQLMYGVPQGSYWGPFSSSRTQHLSLSDIIANHSVNHQLSADDTQLQKSAPLSEVTNLTKELNACTDGVKHGWPKISSNWTTTKQKLFSFPFRLPWNLLPFPSRVLLALTTSPSLILPGTLESFLTQTCPWRSTS